MCFVVMATHSGGRRGAIRAVHWRIYMRVESKPLTAPTLQIRRGEVRSRGSVLATAAHERGRPSPGGLQISTVCGTAILDRCSLTESARGVPADWLQSRPLLSQIRSSYLKLRERTNFGFVEDTRKIMFLVWLMDREFGFGFAKVAERRPDPPR